MSSHFMLNIYNPTELRASRHFEAQSVQDHPPIETCCRRDKNKKFKAQPVPLCRIIVALVVLFVIQAAESLGLIEGIGMFVSWSLQLSRTSD